MKKLLPGFRVILSLIALLGAPLLGCSGTNNEVPTLPPPPAPSLESRQVEFNVIVPAATPCDDTVVLVGNDEALGDWKLPGLRLTRVADDHFRGTATLPTLKTITYNTLLANSGWLELDASDNPVDSRTFTVEDFQKQEEAQPVPPQVISQTVSRWSVVGEMATAPIHFVVEVPSNTPVDAEVWLSGNQPEVGNWNGAGVKLNKSTSSNRYEGCVRISSGANLEFKVTRGSWDTVEKDEQGAEVANHFHEVSGPARVNVRVGSWRDLGPTEPLPDTITGTVRYHDVAGASVGLQDRRLIVWLPPGYDTETARRYPVLYMHDGQNLMNLRTAPYGAEWSVDEAAHRLIQAGEMEPIIIVGVYNTSDRIPEYTQVATSRFPDAGRANDYARLLAEVVKPLIDTTYRTKPEAQYTGVAGSSLGGLVSMYLGLTRSDTFTRLGVISPSVWWAERDIVTRVNNLPAKTPLRIWVDMGTNEDATEAESQVAVDDARALRDALTAKGWVLDNDLKYLEVQGGRHNEAAWAARADQILKYLYPPVP